MDSLELLKKACNLYGQRKVAKSIARSATTINQTLNGTYPNPEPILEMIRLAYGHLDSTDTQCPTLGAIHPQTCERYREWAMMNKVHPDRLYREVKEQCATCTMGGRG
ncbi:MAG: hypothetical protein CJD30_03650 [Sulfuricurvum sp. PD_MW2]|uniref:hypothetical protein n=1 Tax=Sulfuricurvum sp. PD_MW2 TaxID=2027917 RepID=UPI000C066012|nr:hypothetical protein [Sulfuricurvum sp. PD_MW2]PHM18067.1 MAG: hypothetical protein CJD30_03650 [Sulfuricurvum sp. PD_MW2]